MRRILLAAIFGTFIAACVSNQAHGATNVYSTQIQKTAEDVGEPILAASSGFQQITVLTASTTLTVPATARFARITVTGQNVRVRMDGTAPTATIGEVVKTTDPPMMLSRSQAVAAKFIETAASAVLNVQYFE